MKGMISVTTKTMTRATTKREGRSVRTSHWLEKSNHYQGWTLPWEF